ncbi:MAG: hypothetical protein NTV89_07225 [Proteobacteria bacterium]|nr:hypothetical protein [Pseudomonadota bacterium]
MNILLRNVHRVIIISLFLLFICSFSESAGSEPPQPDLASARLQAAESYNRKPDLRPSLFDNEESSTMMKWRMSSIDEKKEETNDPRAPEPLPSPALFKADMAQPNPEHKWQLLFPFFGDEAEKRGHKLPYAIGVTTGFYYGRRHIKASNAKVAIADFTIPADKLTKIKVKSREKNWSVRLDAWIFPFLSVYALGGYTRQYTEAAINVDLLDRIRSRRGASRKEFSVKVDLTGITYGGGMTLVGGYKNYFAALDTNYTISALQGDLIFGNRLSPDVRAMLCSIRLGWRKLLGVSRLSIWAGETYWDTTNTIKGHPDIPVLGKVGFSLQESTIKPWSTHIGTLIEITKTFQFMVDMGSNFSGLFCITPAFIYRF